MTIGERIKLRREQLGMTQDELAELLGYKSKTSINKIEMGKQELTQKKIKAVADALKTSVGYIMGWSDEEPAPEPILTGDVGLMFALWGDTDLMNQEDLAAVKRYAAFLRQEKEGKKNE